MHNKSIQETLYFDGSQFFQALLKDFAYAKKSIALETYIFDDDTLGRKVVEALGEAAKRGVHVRVLVDGCGASHWGGSLTQRLEDLGAETRVYHPFPWRFWQWSRAVIKAPLLLKWLYLLLHINRRNHRKVCIIDNKIAYIGSLNMTVCHLSVDEGGEGWRDTSVRLTDVPIRQLINAYEGAWDHVKLRQRFERLFQQVNTQNPIRLNNSWRRRRALYKDLLRRVSRCRKRIWITNAYFVPDNFLLKKLKDAAHRGVDVRILLPHKSDVLFLPWASTTFYEALLKSGVHIFEYLPSMLHAKTLILDDWMVIGSSNLNYRSLLHDLEIDIALTQPQSRLLLEQQFLLDLMESKVIRLDSWEKRPLYQRLIGRLLLYVKYWI